MSFTRNTGRPGVQVAYPNAADHRRQIAQGVNRALRGHINCTGTLTLTANAASTTVEDSEISPQTCLSFMPQTAHAAAELGNGTMYATCTNGSATITHANNAQTDRTFTMSMIG
jgi:hypothetical protein